MVLFNNLKQDEKEAMEQYIYGTRDTSSEEELCFCGKQGPAPLDYRLREWDTQKEWLYKAFGNSFFIKKEVTFSLGYSDFFPELYNLMNLPLCGKLREALNKGDIKVYNKDGFEDYYSFAFTDVVFDREQIYNNFQSYNSFCVEIKGTRIDFTQGGKILRPLSKVANALGITTEFEEFRLAHSCILNKAKAKGELVISIHPLDYMTMSDNDCNWSSCMSWYDGGCYRRGTVEMMNSPCVVVAYLTAKEPYVIPYTNMKWSNKKWRSLFIVHEGMICSIKNYPFFSKELTLESLEMLKGVMEPLYGKYEGVIDTKRFSFDNPSGGTVSFMTNSMYNDFGTTTHLGYWNLDHCDEVPSEFLYSGADICMWCGGIEKQHYDNSCICCTDCVDGDNGYLGECYYCGNDIYERNDDYYYDEETDSYCCDRCYNEHVSYCTVCEGSAYKENLTPYVISYKGFLPSKKKIDHCLNSFEIFLNDNDFDAIAEEGVGRMCNYCKRRISRERNLINLTPNKEFPLMAINISSYLEQDDSRMNGLRVVGYSPFTFNNLIRDICAVEDAKSKEVDYIAEITKTPFFKNSTDYFLKSAIESCIRYLSSLSEEQKEQLKSMYHIDDATEKETGRWPF